MFAIAILFFLGLWVLVTLFCMALGWKLGRYFSFAGSKGIGVFVGFMLPMGGFIVYWIAEYWILQTRVTHLCETRGGIKVYITPEEYRKMIGEEEWQNLHEIDELIYERDKDRIGNISFQGREYEPSAQASERIRSFEFERVIKGVEETDRIYYDYKMDKVVFQEITYDVGVLPIGLSLEGLKFWLNNIQDCSSDDLSYEERFKIDKYTNIKRSK